MIGYKIIYKPRIYNKIEVQYTTPGTVQHQVHVRGDTCKWVSWGCGYIPLLGHHSHLDSANPSVRIRDEVLNRPEPPKSSGVPLRHTQSQPRPSRECTCRCFPFPLVYNGTPWAQAGTCIPSSTVSRTLEESWRGWWVLSRMWGDCCLLTHVPSCHSKSFLGHTHSNYTYKRKWAYKLWELQWMWECLTIASTNEYCLTQSQYPTEVVHPACLALWRVVRVIRDWGVR